MMVEAKWDIEYGETEVIKETEISEGYRKVKVKPEVLNEGREVCSAGKGYCVAAFLV
jgi:hypothetical protein